jgi:hypothetical protein
LNEEWKQSFGEDFHNLIYPDTVKAIQKINNPYVNELLGNMKSGGSITGSASGAGKGGKTLNELMGKGNPNEQPVFDSRGNLAGYSVDGKVTRLANRDELTR